MLPTLTLLLTVCVAPFVHPDGDLAYKDYEAKLVSYPGYLSLADCPPGEREKLRKSLRFLLPSLSPNQYLGDQLPTDLSETLLRLDLEGLGPGWIKHWPEVQKLYAKEFRPDLSVLKKLPLVVSGLWFHATIPDSTRTDLQYKLLYNDKVPKTLDDFTKFWKVSNERGYEFGFLEGDSLVKAPNADKERSVEFFPGAAWNDVSITYDSKVVAGKTDQLENLLARPVKHDASEAIAGMVKHFVNEKGEQEFGRLQAYLLANGEGKRAEKAPGDIVWDSEQTRGAEIINTLSCIYCHENGLRDFTSDRYRGYILSGGRLSASKKEDAREIDRYFAPLNKLVLRINEDYATALRLCNGLTPAKNAANFRSLIHLYDSPLNIKDAAREIYTDQLTLQLALADASRKGVLTGNLVLLAVSEDNTISRSKWTESFGTVQIILAKWKELSK